LAAALPAGALKGIGDAASSFARTIFWIAAME
jgi:hypothetical protein